MAVGRFFKGTPQEYTNLNPYVELPFKEMLALAEMGNAKIDNASKNLELYYSDMLKKAAMPNSEDEAYLKAAQQKIYDIQKNVDPDKLLDPSYLQGIKSDVLATTKDPYLDDITKSAANYQEYIQAANKDSGRLSALMFNSKDYDTKTKGTFNQVYEHVQDPTAEANAIASRFGSESYTDPTTGLPMQGISKTKINRNIEAMVKDVDFLNNSIVTRQRYDLVNGVGSYNAAPFENKQAFAREYWREQLYPLVTSEVDWQGVNALNNPSGPKKSESNIPDLAYQYLNADETSLPSEIIEEVLGSKVINLETVEGNVIQAINYIPQKDDNVIMDLAHSIYPEAVELSPTEQNAADLSDKMSTWLSKPNNRNAFELYKQTDDYVKNLTFEYDNFVKKYVGNDETNAEVHKTEKNAIVNKLTAAQAKLNNILKASPELNSFKKQSEELNYDLTKAEFENDILNLGERKQNDLDNATNALGNVFENSNRPFKFIPNSGMNKINVYNRQTGETDVLLNGYALMTKNEIWSAIPGSEGKVFDWSDLGEKLIENKKIIPYTGKGGDSEEHLGLEGTDNELFLVPVYINSKGFKEATKLDAINRKVLTPTTATENAANFTERRGVHKLDMLDMNSQKSKFYNSTGDTAAAIYKNWSDQWANIKAQNAAGNLYAEGTVASFSAEQIKQVDDAFDKYKSGTISKREFMETWTNLLDMQYNRFNPAYIGKK